MPLNFIPQIAFQEKFLEQSVTMVTLENVTVEKQMVISMVLNMAKVIQLELELQTMAMSILLEMASI